MEIKVFQNAAFGTIRTMQDEKGEPLFCAKDVAEALGYDQPRKAVERHVDKDDGTKRTLIDSMGRKQRATFVNESGLYALILSSKLPKAREFKHWVTSEVLPPSVGRVDTWWPRGKPANMYHKSQITVSKRCRVEGWGMCQNAFFSFFRRG